MENEKLKKLQKPLFLIVAIGLIPIALSYRLMPDNSPGFLFEIDITNLSLETILPVANIYYYSTTYDYFTIAI